jgi:protein TonB
VAFAALARLPRGETRPAAVLEFDAGVPIAWVSAVEVEDEPFVEPAPLVEPGPPPPRFDPPPVPDAELPLSDLQFTPPDRDDGELEPDPSFTDLPVLDDAPAVPRPPEPSLRTEARLAACRLPPRPAPAPIDPPPAPIGESAPADSAGPATEAPSGRVVAAVARSHGNAPPDYPREARRQGVEGVVLLRVAIAADGACSGVSIEKSSGHAALDDAAVAAVRNWRFSPALEDGVAVASELLVPIRFVLKAGGAG